MRLRGWTALVGAIALAAGCAGPGANAPAGAGLVTARPSPERTPAPIVSGANAGGLISNMAEGLLANNAGGLAGTVRVPRAALVAEHAATVLFGNWIGLLAASPAPAAPADRLEPAPAGTRVMVLEAADGGFGAPDQVAGTRLDLDPAVTTADGAFTFDRLKASGPLVVVRALVPVDGRELVIEALLPAPRAIGMAEVGEVGPASTLVSRKLRAARVARSMPDGGKALADLATAVDRTAGDVGVVAAVVLPEADAVKAFDAMVANSPALRTAVGEASAAILGLAD